MSDERTQEQPAGADLSAAEPTAAHAPTPADDEELSDDALDAVAGGRGPETGKPVSIRPPRGG